MTGGFAISLVVNNASGSKGSLFVALVGLINEPRRGVLYDSGLSFPGSRGVMTDVNRLRRSPSARFRKLFRPEQTFGQSDQLSLPSFRKPGDAAIMST
jgi:hypothetical protein